LAHALLTAGDNNSRSAGLDLLRTQRNGTQSRTADLVDAPRWRIHGYARSDGRAPRRPLTLCSREHLTENDFGNIAGLHIGALERGLDGNSAEFMGRE
jgi:hypothetical protein